MSGVTPKIPNQVRQDFSLGSLFSWGERYTSFLS